MVDVENWLMEGDFHAASPNTYSYVERTIKRNFLEGIIKQSHSQATRPLSLERLVDHSVHLEMLFSGYDEKNGEGIFMVLLRDFP